MRTFKGFVQYGDTLASLYEENGQTFVEPVSSYSQANSMIDLRQQQQQNQQGSPQMNQLGYRAGQYFANRGGSGGFDAVGNTMTGGMEAAPSGGGTGGGGLGVAGYGAIILAAIAAQHAMSKNTDREFEGVRTEDAFSGHFGTEPWLAFAYDKLGIDVPSAGEKFDAAIENRDWATAAKRLPSTLQYWGDPATSIGYDVAKDKWGGTTAAILNPWAALLDWIGG